MLLNPFQSILKTIPGSRMLVEPLGLIGATFDDLKDRDRNWVITNLFAPIHNRHLGGIRVKLEDQKGFVTFCNQRDLELLLGLAKPGDLCAWTGKDYPDFKSYDFYGMCADTEDLEDDLFERELQLRNLMAQAPECSSVSPMGYSLTRRVHLSKGQDVEQLDMMLYDCDPETGYGPDPRFETLTCRWTKVERTPTNWYLL